MRIKIDLKLKKADPNFKKFGDLYIYVSDNINHRLDDIFNYIRQDELSGLYYEHIPFYVVYFRENMEKIFVIGDFFGFQDFYYTFENNIFQFSSDLKDFSDRSLSKEWEAFFLKFGFNLNNKTFFKDVKRKGSNTLLEICENGVLEDNIYDFQKQEEIDKELALEKIEYDLIDYFKKLKGNTVNILYSGGIDSSVLVLAALNSGKKVNTFSLSFENKDFDEKIYREDFLNGLDVNHHEMTINHEKYADYLKRISREDFFVPMLKQDIPAFCLLIERFSLAGQNVVFGLGADEWFFGYDYSVRAYLNKRNSRIFDEMTDSFSENNQVSGITEIIHNEFINENKFHTSYIPEYFSQKEINQYVSEDFSFNRNEFDYKNIKNSIIKFQLEEEFANNQLLRLKAIERFTGVNVLLPFCQFNILRLACNIPFEYCVDKKKKKSIIYDLFRENIPEIIYERKKRGFSIPIKKWLDTNEFSFIRERVTDVYGKDIEVISRKVNSEMFVERLFILYSIIIMKQSSR